MNTTRMIRTLLFSLLAVVTAASWAQAATQTFEFKPPATDPDKRNGPGGLPGWSACASCSAVRCRRLNS